MTVDLRSEVVLCKYELLQCMNSVSRDHHYLAPIHWVFDHLKFAMKLLKIEHPVLDPAEIAVSLKVVLFIRVERTGDDRPQDGLVIPLREKLFDLIECAPTECIYEIGFVRKISWVTSS